MKSNMSTCATSSSPSSVALSALESGHVMSIGPRQIVFTTRIFSFGGARLPLYTQDEGEPSSKLNRYANHSVGWIKAGSDSLKPLKTSPCASFRSAELKPPVTVGGTFAIVTAPSVLPSPWRTVPVSPLTWTLSMIHHQSSLLSYRQRRITLDCPCRSRVCAVREPRSEAGLLWWYSARTTGYDAPPSVEAS